MHPHGYPPVAYVPPTSGKAVAALILGLVSIGGGVCLVVPPILAVWFGHEAIRETRPGRRGGHGMAVAGLIMGYAMLIPLLIGALIGVMALIASYAPA